MLFGGEQLDLIDKFLPMMINLLLRPLECVTYCMLFHEDAPVKGLSKVDRDIVSHLFSLLDADHIVDTALDQIFAHELRFTGETDDQVDIGDIVLHEHVRHLFLC